MSKKATKSYSNFVQYSGVIEFLIIYLLLAKHPNKEEMKTKLEHSLDTKMNLNNSEYNILGDFLKLSDSDSIFNPSTYEDVFGQMAYSRLMDSCLCYIKEVLSEIIRSKPEILKSKDTESLDYILSFKNMNDLIDDLVEKKITQLFYGSVNTIEKYFKDRLKIDLFNKEKDKKEFNQLVKQRNLIVHNRGIITKEFAKEFKEYEKNVGDMISFKYHRLSIINNYLIHFLLQLDQRLSKKYNLELMDLIKQTT